MPQLRAPDGAIVDLPDEQVSQAIAGGYEPVGGAETSQTRGAVERPNSGVLAPIGAAASSFLSGASLGLSDLAFKGLLDKGAYERLAEDRAQHPIVSGAGQIAGAAMGGATPAGALGRATGAIAEGGGLAAKIAAGGIEGSVFNAGAYLSDSALEDRELSAEGLRASLGAGFEFGAAGGVAALGIERGTIAARRMFSRLADGTERVANEAEQAWRAKYQSTIEAHDAAADAARAKLAEASLARQQAQVAQQRQAAAVADARAGARAPGSAAESAPAAPVLAGEAPAAASTAVPGATSTAPPVPAEPAPHPDIEIAGLLHDRAMAAAQPEQLAAWDAQHGQRLQSMMAARQVAGGIPPQLAELSARLPETAASRAAALSEAAEAELAGALREHDAAKADLEGLLQRLEVPDVGQPGGVIGQHTVPVGEFGAPGAGGVRRLGEDLAPRPPTAAEAPTGDVTAVGRRRPAVEATPVEQRVTDPAAAPREIRTDDEFRAVQQELRAKLTPDEIKQSIRFSREYYIDVNRHLRGVDRYATLPESEAKIMPALDSILDKSVTPEPLVTHRGASINRAGKLEPGDVFEDPGYQSTSYHSEKIRRFGEVHVVVTSPAGTKIAAIPSSAAEGEFLLPRNTKLRITARDVNPKGEITLHATVEQPAASDTLTGQLRGTAAPFSDAEMSAMRSSAPWEQHTSATLRSYSGDDIFIDLNRGLRNGTASAEQRATAEEINAALKRTPAPRDATVYRWVAGDVGDRGAATDIYSKLKLGDSFTENGFSSTTSEEAIAHREARSRKNQKAGVVLRIEVPRGTPMGAIPSDVAETEKELLLQHGTRYRVTRVTTSEDGVRVIDVAIEPSAAASAATDTLTGQLRGTANKLGAGEDLVAMGAPARAEYVAAKAERTAAAAEHFRGQALAARDAAAATAPAPAHDLETLLRGSNYALEQGATMREMAQAEAAVRRQLGEAAGHPLSVRSLEQAHDAAVERAAAATESAERTAATADAKAIEQQLTAVGKRPGAVEDVAAAAPVVTRYERAAAKLTETLGDAAPPAAREAAQTFRAAEDAAERKTLDRTTRAIDEHVTTGHATTGPAAATRPPATSAAEYNAKRQAAGLPDALARPPKPGAGPEVAAARSTKLRADADLARARAAETEARMGSDAAKRRATETRTTAEAARPQSAAAPSSKLGSVLTAVAAAGELGVPGIPHPHDIPVIGPLLSLWTKYRIAKAMVGRFAGRVAATGDTRAAALAARAKDKIAAAVDRTLGLAAEVAPKLRRPIVLTATVLGHRLIDDGEPDAPKGASAQQLAAVRIREISAAATRPELVTAMVRKQLGSVADPDLIAAAEKVLQQQFQALAQTMPKLPPDNPYAKTQFTPSLAAAAELAQRIGVMHDPATAFNNPTPAKADALASFYPKLFAFGQQRLAERAAELEHPMPYRQQLQATLIFRVPVASAMDPGRLAVLQSAHAAIRADITPAPSAPPPSPPPPSVAGPTNLNQMYQTSADRRAARSN